MSSMDDLITWLRAQIDEGEAHGRKVAKLVAEDEAWMADVAWMPDPPSGEPGKEFLADLESKRRLVELHSPANPNAEPREGSPGWPDKPWLYCATCGSGEPNEYPITWPCETIKLVALPFSDRPGYREEWKP
jgi:hypothetical protein